MRSALLNLLFAAIALGSLVDAARPVGPTVKLFRRQAFDPDEESRPGDSCVEAFGPGFIECVPGSRFSPALCYSPGEGEVCCNNLWGCPKNSFCLVDGLCCPNGRDPQTCADRNGITLPSNFGSAPKTTSSPAAPKPATTQPPVATTDAAEAATTDAPFTAVFTPATTSTSSSSTRTAATTTSSLPVQVNGAGRHGAGLAAVVVGAVAMAL